MHCLGPRGVVTRFNLQNQEIKIKMKKKKYCLEKSNTGIPAKIREI
jgi:hypothetical protein